MYHLLLVDDESSVLSQRSDFLEKQGCFVHCASNSSQALEFVSQNSYDCIILDVMLEETTGFSLCEKIKELTHSPIVFLSSLSDDEHQIDGFSSGGVDYITKDTGLQLFWTKIKTRISLSSDVSTVLVFGPLTIDLTTRKLFIDGVEIVFTSSEFNIISLLASQPNKIFSLSEIYLAIWGIDLWDKGQTVQVHMSHARKKLEKAFSRHYFIETVWGKGYRFVPFEK